MEGGWQTAQGGESREGRKEFPTHLWSKNNPWGQALLSSLGKGWMSPCNPSIQTPFPALIHAHGAGLCDGSSVPLP